MPWYIYTVLASFLFAIAIIHKRRFFHQEKDLNFWSSIFGFLMTLFLIPIIQMPNLTTFYIIAFFNGLAGVCGGVLQVKLSQKQHGKIFALQMPLQVIFCFIAYCFVSPDYLETLVAFPLSSVSIILSLLTLFTALQYLRQADHNWRNLALVTPVAAFIGIMFVCYKQIILTIGTNATDFILVYVMVHYFTISMYYLIEHLVSQKAKIEFDEKLIVNSMILSMVFIFGYFFLFFGVYLAPNPAYVLAFNLTIPIWVKFYNIHTRRQDDTNIKLSIIMLLALSLLIIAS